MGLFNSEHVENSGDHQTHIINHLESHTDALAKSDLKLWIVIALLVAQWLLILYKHHKKQSRQQAIKAARSIAALQDT